MALAITRTEHTAVSLRAEACKVKDARQARRLLSLAAVLDGKSRTEAAALGGMDRQTLADWVHRYNDEGISGLCDRHRSGRRAGLSEEQAAAFAKIVEAGPDLQTDGVVRWRRVDLARVLKERFDVEVHERTVSKILHRLGFTKLSVRPQHPRNDEATMEAFKKTSRIL